MLASTVIIKLSRWKSVFIYVFNIQLIMSNGYDPTLGASQECKHCLENMAEDSL